MKKLIVLLLVVALLVPMCLVANAAVAKKDFYGVVWGNDCKGFSNVKDIYTITISMQGSNVRLGSLVYGSIDDAKVEEMAQSLKEEMDKREEGARYIHFFGPDKALALIEKEVYLDAATEQLKVLCEALFAKYQKIGGKVDGATMSMLYSNMSSYYINQKAAKDAKLYSKIVKDPRYKTDIRPMLEERGFTFYTEQVTDYTPEIYGISGKAGSKYANCQAIWNTVMKTRLNTSITQWAYEPMATYFPDVHVSDYQSTDTDAWMKPVDESGNVMGSGGNALRAGNTSCENFYSARPNADFFKSSGQPVYKNIPSYMGAAYKQTSFNNFRYDMNVAKQVYIADANNDACYWISKYSSTEDKNNEISNSPYYAEQLFHLCLYDPKPFLVFFNSATVKGDELNQCATIVNDLLREVSRVAGYADRKPIETPVDWNSEFVISGMYANGRNIWRISPNRDLTTKEAFKVSGKDPTFSLAGQTVTFPDGKIIEDTKISTVGTMGYWVETPANKTPVITSAADRFEKFPAYIEDYESYAVNGKLQSNNLRDLGAWIVKANGSDLSIASFAGSKVLSITGNSVLENKLIPANLTVGDEYAKKQSWEVTIIIPDGIDKDAQMVLLNYTASGTAFDDGGFKLQGNKLYYGIGKEDADGNPVYEELTDVKGGIYTLKREMHFGQDYFCDYIVTDGGGNVLKAMENVKIPAFSGKVSSIGMTCYNMNKKIQLDNYTLRVTGAGADLSVYDTALGTKVADGAKHTASVTYRLSWANASEKNETATVKAEITQSGKTTVKTLGTVTMKPGCDGVEYGTVDVKSGQSVRIYLETSIKDEKLEEPTPTEPTESKATAATTASTKATIPPFTKPTRPSKASTATKVTKVTKVTQATGTAVTTEATGSMEVTEATVITEATESTTATQATAPAEPEKKDGLNIGLIVVFAVVIMAAAAGGATFFLLKKKKPAAPAAEEIENIEESAEAEEKTEE